LPRIFYKSYSETYERIIMDMKDHVNRITETTDKFKKTSTPEEKEELTQQFWIQAIEAFNDQIAGDATTIDGRIIHTPEIEL
jgi:thiaminase